jgi:hypothetical protein
MRQAESLSPSEQSISGVINVSLLVAFYDIRERTGEVLFFCSVTDTTRWRHYVYTMFIKLQFDADRGLLFYEMSAAYIES